MTELRISVRNTSETGGTFLSPFWFALHDGSFDLFDFGTPASPELERLAEDGATADLDTVLTAGGNTVGLVTGVGGFLATQERANVILDVDGAAVPYFTAASMVLPSNDAFVGIDTSIRLFADDGRFLGAELIRFTGQDVLDAGTEENTELDAAFVNQTAPDTGIDQGGAISEHDGFIGSEGNRFGAPIILGGANQAGAPVDQIPADFTRLGNLIADVHVNEVTRFDGGSSRDIYRGASTDDIVTGAGDRDILFGNAGFDSLSGGAERDLIFGGAGEDILGGGDGNDRIAGGDDDDILNGGGGRDRVEGNDGDDVLNGGGGRDRLDGDDGHDALFGGSERDFLFGGDGDDDLVAGLQNDRLWGGDGRDRFIFSTGDAKDRVDDFAAEDQIVFLNTAFETLEDVLAASRQVGGSVRIDYGDSDFVVLRNVDLDTLVSDNFEFTLL